jgi:iron complex transport system substrate-binding protein
MNQDPEIILKMQEYLPGGWFAGGYPLSKTNNTQFDETKMEIMNRSELQDIAAIRDDRVYIIAYSISYGSKHFIGIAYLAKWFYPDLFEDLDPQAIHQEYLTRFQGLDYDLDKYGVFVYPPQEMS